MIETLYETNTPEKGRSECYVLVFTARPASEGKVYVFMEEHGRWDDGLGHFHYEVNSVSTEGRLTREEALAMYNTAKNKLAQRGFIHAFAPNYSRKMPHKHQLCELEAVSA
ncbi:MAG: hypothetical protein WCF30_14350 [Terracidiphilus sp.]